MVSTRNVATNFVCTFAVLLPLCCACLDPLRPDQHRTHDARTTAQVFRVACCANQISGQCLSLEKGSRSLYLRFLQHTIMRTGMTVTPTTTASVPPSRNSILDRQLFLCQNAMTGEILPNRWTLRQICRMLCPPSSNTNPTEETTATTLSPDGATLSAPLTQDANSSSSNRFISPQSQLLAIEMDGTYSAAGWKPPSEIDILREAASLWFYQSTPSSSNEQSSGAAKGPISCRALSALLEQNLLPLMEETRVYSDVTSVWDPISRLSNLRMALDAFRVPVLLTTTPTEESSGEQNALSSSEIAFPSENEMQRSDTQKNISKDAIRDELEAFLVSTERNLSTEIRRATNDDEDDGENDNDNAESYESDGGTVYVKDAQTGQWVTKRNNSATSSKLLQSNRDDGKQLKPGSSGPSNIQRKRKRPKFSAKNAKCWVYITGLPTDCTADELQQVFSKAGIIDLDPESQLPKIKIYRHRDGSNKGQAKGDASICYARPESVGLAIALLDDSELRPSAILQSNGTDCLRMKVQPAKFEQHGEKFDSSHAAVRVSNAKRQVAKMAAIQAMDWDDGEVNGRISGGRKGLRIVVLKHLFDPNVEMMDDARLQSLEDKLRSTCTTLGEVEKITVFARNPDGVVVVKFATPGAASEAVKYFNGREWNGQSRLLRSHYWDGVTDFTIRDEAKEEMEMERRHEEFGDWLEEQELPEELRLKNTEE